jgi:hypothetical protein
MAFSDHVVLLEAVERPQQMVRETLFNSFMMRAEEDSRTSSRLLMTRRYEAK